MTRSADESRNAQGGFAMMAGLLLGLALSGLGVVALVYVKHDLDGTGHFKRGKQAMAAAESGALHALATINTRLVRDFEHDIVDQWDSANELLGSSPQSMSTSSSLRYRVDVESDPSDPRAFGIITARGASGADRNGVRLRVQRRFRFDWGAIYLSHPEVASNFDGNSLEIDGTNYRAFADEPAGDGLEVPGIGTYTSDAADAIRQTVDENQDDNVRGLGSEPSVMNVGGPSSEQIGEIAQAVLGLGAHVTYHGNSGGALNGSLVMGTLAHPQVSYLTGADRITGNVEGSGILIVDGDVRLTGNFAWTGWVVVLGSLTVSGNATVQGATWATDIDFTGQGNMTARFCIECIQLVNSSVHLDRLPSKMDIVGWEELPWEEL